MVFEYCCNQQALRSSKGVRSGGKMARVFSVIVATLMALSALAAVAAPIAASNAIVVKAGEPGSLLPDDNMASSINLDGAAPGLLPSYVFDSGGPNGAVTLTGTGVVANTSLDGVYAKPAGVIGNYLAVSGISAEGSVSLAFSVPENYLGLFWGSIDPYNSIKFLNDGEMVSVYSGDMIANIVGLSSDGSRNSTASNRYVNFYTGDSFFDQVILSTTNFNFEVANIAFGDPPISVAAVPEPSSLILFGSALSVMAVVRRRRHARQRELQGRWHVAGATT